MYLPGFGWPNFHAQGCDSARHAQQLILICLPRLFPPAEALEALPGHQGRDSQPGPIPPPCLGCRAPGAPLRVAPAGWGWWGAAHRALRWPVTLNRVFVTLKTTCSRVSHFSSEVIKMWGNYRFKIFNFSHKK